MSWSQCNTVIHTVDKERQRYWIHPREPGWRISFHFTMTFFQFWRWSAPLLPPSSYIPTVQIPLHCCHSFFFPFVNLFSPQRRQSSSPLTCWQRDHISMAHLSSHQLLSSYTVCWFETLICFAMHSWCIKRKLHRGKKKTSILNAGPLVSDI